MRGFRRGGVWKTSFLCFKPTALTRAIFQIKAQYRIWRTTQLTDGIAC